MAVMVALLRGVNVGGKNKLAMADLRSAAEACRYEQARTYIQSGNLVFSAPTGSTKSVAELLGKTIADKTGLHPDVIVRTSRQLATVVDQNPYLRRGEDTAHLHVVFIGGGAPASLGSIDPAQYEPEEAAAAGQQIYLFLPGGLGRSKLAGDLARQKGVRGTTRNWRTVGKLLELAEQIG